MYQEDLTKKLAEAAKGVIEGKKMKETEVQPSDKDFVDLHSIDKEKRRGSTPLTEKDVEEANEFTKAAAKAAVAGDSEFEFEGKKFPTEIDVDVAKKILGESVELDEAYIDVDAADPKSIEFANLMKKYRVKARIITMKGPGGGMPLVRLTGKKKDLVGILKDPMGWQDDGFLAGFIEEGKTDSTESQLQEKFVSTYDKAIEKAVTKDDVLKLYPKADFPRASTFGGFATLEKNLFMKYYFTGGGKFYVQKIYSKKGKNYVDLYDIPEPMNQNNQMENIHKLTESNTDKYMWKDINNALKAAGLDIRTILSVVSKLKGKEIKEDNS